MIWKVNGKRKNVSNVVILAAAADYMIGLAYRRVCHELGELTNYDICWRFSFNFREGHTNAHTTPRHLRTPFSWHIWFLVHYQSVKRHFRDLWKCGSRVSVCTYSMGCSLRPNKRGATNNFNMFNLQNRLIKCLLLYRFTCVLQLRWLVVVLSIRNAADGGTSRHKLLR